MRVNESLYFASAGFLKDYLYNRKVKNSEIKHLVLMCSAVNEIDMSAMESLEAANLRLKDLGIQLHLSEVKGPVMGRLAQTHFLKELTGSVFLSQYEAIKTLTPLMSESENAARLVK